MVPVMVELCPAAINATANRMGAHLLPSRGCNKRCASCISATCVFPVEKNTVAARIRIAAFTKKAALRAMVLSIKLYRMAFRMPSRLELIFRVCTNAECRYKLCGITVAPIIPIAMYKDSLFSGCGINPVTTKPNCGFAITICNKKQSPIMATSAMIKASIFRIPKRWSSKNRKVSNTVITVPVSSGNPVNK